MSNRTSEKNFSDSGDFSFDDIDALAQALHDSSSFESIDAALNDESIGDLPAVEAALQSLTKEERNETYRVLVFCEQRKANRSRSRNFTPSKNYKGRRLQIEQEEQRIALSATPFAIETFDDGNISEEWSAIRSGVEIAPTIENSKLVNNSGHTLLLSREIDSVDDLRVCADITPVNGYGGTPSRFMYFVQFEGPNGNTYVTIQRSSANYNNSAVIVNHPNGKSETITPSFQFVAKLHLDLQLTEEGQIVGTVSEGGKSVSINTTQGDPVTVEAFHIHIPQPDTRTSRLTYATLDNLALYSDDITPEVEEEEEEEIADEVVTENVTVDIASEDFSSGTLSEGWEVVCNSAAITPTITNGKLVNNTGKALFLSHDIDGVDNLHAKLDISCVNGYGGTLSRFSHYIQFKGPNGSTYVTFQRSSRNYNNSAIIVSHSNGTSEKITSPFQFNSVLHVDLQLTEEGQIVGTVSEGSNQVAINTTQGDPLVVDVFALCMPNPDTRASKITYATLDNLVLQTNETIEIENEEDPYPAELIPELSVHKAWRSELGTNILSTLSQQEAYLQTELAACNARIVTEGEDTREPITMSESAFRVAEHERNVRQIGADVRDGAITISGSMTPKYQGTVIENGLVYVDWHSGSLLIKDDQGNDQIAVSMSATNSNFERITVTVKDLQRNKAVTTYTEMGQDDTVPFSVECRTDAINVTVNDASISLERPTFCSLDSVAFSSQFEPDWQMLISQEGKTLGEIRESIAADIASVKRAKENLTLFDALIHEIESGNAQDNRDEATLATMAIALRLGAEMEMTRTELAIDESPEGVSTKLISQGKGLSNVIALLRDIPLTLPNSDEPTVLPMRENALMTAVQNTQDAIAQYEAESTSLLTSMESRVSSPVQELLNLAEQQASFVSSITENGRTGELALEGIGGNLIVQTLSGKTGIAPAQLQLDVTNNAEVVSTGSGLTLTLDAYGLTQSLAFDVESMGKDAPITVYAYRNHERIATLAVDDGHVDLYAEEGITHVLILNPVLSSSATSQQTAPLTITNVVVGGDTSASPLYVQEANARNQKEVALTSAPKLQEGSPTTNNPLFPGITVDTNSYTKIAFQQDWIDWRGHNVYYTNAQGNLTQLDSSRYEWVPGGIVIYPGGPQYINFSATINSSAQHYPFMLGEYSDNIDDVTPVDHAVAYAGFTAFRTNGKEEGVFEPFQISGERSAVGGSINAVLELKNTGGRASHFTVTITNGSMTKTFHTSSYSSSPIQPGQTVYVSANMYGSVESDVTATITDTEGHSWNTNRSPREAKERNSGNKLSAGDVAEIDRITRKVLAAHDLRVANGTQGRAIAMDSGTSFDNIVTRVAQEVATRDDAGPREEEGKGVEDVVIASETWSALEENLMSQTDVLTFGSHEISLLIFDGADFTFDLEQDGINTQWYSSLYEETRAAFLSVYRGGKYADPDREVRDEDNIIGTYVEAHAGDPCMIPLSQSFAHMPEETALLAEADMDSLWNAKTGEEAQQRSYDIYELFGFLENGDQRQQLQQYSDELDEEFNDLLVENSDIDPSIQLPSSLSGIALDEVKEFYNLLNESCKDIHADITRDVIAPLQRELHDIEMQMVNEDNPLLLRGLAMQREMLKANILFIKILNSYCVDIPTLATNVTLELAGEKIVAVTGKVLSTTGRMMGKAGSLTINAAADSAAYNTAIQRMEPYVGKISKIIITRLEPISTKLDNWAQNEFLPSFTHLGRLQIQKQRGLKYLQETYGVEKGKWIHHIVYGEFGRKGAAVGGHTELASDWGISRIINIIRESADGNLKEVNLQVRDLITGKWISKGPKSTIITNKLSQSEIVQMTSEAYDEILKMGIGQHDYVINGIKFTGSVYREGRIGLLFPTLP